MTSNYYLDTDGRTPRWMRRIWNDETNSPEWVPVESLEDKVECMLEAVTKMYIHATKGL